MSICYRMDEVTVYSFNETLNRMRMDELLLCIITWINLTDKFWKKQDRKQRENTYEWFHLYTIQKKTRKTKLWWQKSGLKGHLGEVDD